MSKNSDGFAKKSDAKRGLILFKSLVGSKTLERGVANLRNKFGPYGSLNRKEEIEFVKLVDQLLIKLKLPLNYWWQEILISYISRNEIIEPPMSSPFIEILKRVDKSHGGYTDIRFYDGVSQRDVEDFYKKHWNVVKPSYIKGTRKIIQPERDSEMTTKLLKEWSKDLGKGYKEINVARIVPPKSPKKYWPGAVKARVTRKLNKSR